MIANTLRNPAIPRIKVTGNGAQRAQRTQRAQRKERERKDVNPLPLCSPLRSVFRCLLLAICFVDEAVFEGEGGGGDAVGDAELA